jgi:hypothetical protein
MSISTKTVNRYSNDDYFKLQHAIGTLASSMNIGECGAIIRKIVANSAARLIRSSTSKAVLFGQLQDRHFFGFGTQIIFSSDQEAKLSYFRGKNNISQFNGSSGYRLLGCLEQFSRDQTQSLRTLKAMLGLGQDKLTVFNDPCAECLDPQSNYYIDLRELFYKHLKASQTVSSICTDTKLTEFINATLKLFYEYNIAVFSAFLDRRPDEVTIPEVFPSLFLKPLSLQSDSTNIHIARSQFIQAYPFWGDMFKDSRLATTIETRQPIESLLKTHFEISRGLLTRMRNLHPYCLDERIARGISNSIYPVITEQFPAKRARLLSFLGDIPLSKIPIIEKQSSVGLLIRPKIIDTFLQIERAIEQLCTATDVEADNIKNLLLRNLGRQTRGEIEGLGAFLANTTPALLNDSADYIRHIASRTFFIAFVRSQGEARIREIGSNKAFSLVKLATLGMLSEYWSLARVIRESGTWHRNMHLYQASSDQQAFWPSLCNEVIAPNGYFAIPLFNSEQLLEEGKALKHCVAGYDSKCLRAESIIVSITNPERVKEATLELSFYSENGRHQVREKQLRGWKNQEANSASKKAAAYFIDQVNKGRIPVSWEPLITLWELFNLNTICGCDPLDDINAQISFNSAREFLPSGLSTSSIDEFTQHEIVQKFIGVLNSDLNH